MSQLAPTTVLTPALTDAPATNLVFGLNFNLHGTIVPVSTADMGTDPKSNGITFNLPAPVDLGTLTDFQAWFKQQFGIDLPLGTKLPPPLGSIMDKLSTLDVSVNQFSIKVPGTKSEIQSTQYTLGMTAQWPAGQGIPLVPGVLTIDGAVFGATNVASK